MSTPRLVKQGNKTVLMVHDKPFVALGGEVHNSDSSSPEYMEKIWQIGQDLGMNTLLLPVSWEMTEPEEGRFDFSVPEKLILQARERGMKIVFLWFGSWKNAEMMYAPEWVKRDTDRFPRAEIVKGEKKAGRPVAPGSDIKNSYYSLSYLGEETMKADARAFAEYMGFLKGMDETENTVIAVQVENETGLLGSAREVSDAADALFDGPAPQDFVDYMNAHTATMVPQVGAAVVSGAKTGTWRECFGPAAEELFSAYYIAGYVNYVAEAGKAVYDLPMAANCWLNKKNDAPGAYPSGGPVSRVHEVWHFRAPQVQLLCPDIYVPNFMEICDEYTRREGAALFIPEAATHSYAAPRLVYTVGHHHAVCYSPFGFDDIGKPFTAIQGYLFGMDVTDPALKTPQNFQEYGATGKLLQGLMPLLGAKLGTGDLDAVCGETSDISTMVLGDLMVIGSFKSMIQPRSDGYLLALRTGVEELYLLANACSIRLQSADPAKPNMDLTLVEEGCFDAEGTWHAGRRLNGDETALFGANAPTLLKVRYFTYD